MKVKCLNIRWSSSKTKELTPIYSLDFHNSGLLATGAGDKEIQIWNIHKEEEDTKIEHICTIVASQSAVNVNCVRFSPNGCHLASAADQGEVNIWTSDKQLPNNKKKDWRKKNLFGAPKADILDICWSNDGTSLAIASVDNTVAVCDTASGSLVNLFTGHRNLVQGVAWDPNGIFLASQSADRSCRIYRTKSTKQWCYKDAREAAKDMTIIQILQNRKHSVEVLNTVEINSLETTERENNAFKPKKMKFQFSTGYLMFTDDSGPIFRRLSWSPDGSLLAIPAGIFQYGPSFLSSLEYKTTYIFSRNNWKKPIGQLPTLATPTVVAKWCPRLYRNRMAKESNEKCYHMYLAVANSDSVFIYDTECIKCKAFVGGLHLASITDLAWSNDGKILAISSRDGFCSFITLNEEDLGEKMPADFKDKDMFYTFKNEIHSQVKSSSYTYLNMLKSDGKNMLEMFVRNKFNYN
jgi:chromatin assembly factor 1 subunit B